MYGNAAVMSLLLPISMKQHRLFFLLSPRTDHILSTLEYKFLTVAEKKVLARN